MAGDEPERDFATVRADTLVHIRQQSPAVAWPLADPSRTLAQLHDLANQVQRRRLEREQAAADSARRKRLKTIAANPQALIARVEKLLQIRSLTSYEQAAAELVDLREALGPDGPERVREVVETIRSKNAKRNQLIRVLRNRGLL
jgi:hypothetical protein